MFYGTTDDFQVHELLLASSESFWFREPRAKRKYEDRDLEVPKNPAQVLVKESLTVQRATCRAQRDKPKLKMRKSVHRVHETKQHAWGFEKPRTQTCQETQVCEDLPS